MSQQNPDFWNKARHVCDVLIDQFSNYEEVSLIDIGYGLTELGKRSEEIVVRIHVEASWQETKPEDRIIFPKQIDDVPIIVISGDYRLAQ